MVEHTVRDREVVSSSLTVPTGFSSVKVYPGNKRDDFQEPAGRGFILEISLEIFMYSSPAIPTNLNIANFADSLFARSPSLWRGERATKRL